MLFVLHKFEGIKTSKLMMIISLVLFTSFGVSASMVQEVAIDNHWSTVSFDPLGETPVIIAGPATNHDSAPGTVQLRNVVDGSTEIRFAEWDYLDDSHSSENISIMALPQGRHNMPDGSVWEVGTIDVTGDRVAFTKTFSAVFEGTPTLILTAQTANDGTPYTVRAKSVSASSFVVRINEEELTKNSAHATETIGYVAIYNTLSSGNAEFNGVSFDYMFSSGSLNHQWKTLEGYSLKVEEEQSKGTEINHTSETIDLLLINDLLFAQDVLTKGGDSSALRRDTESPSGTEPNVAPTITSTAITSVNEFANYTYDVNATDPDAGDILSFSLSVFPSGMTINTISGEINWLSNDTQVGDHSVIVAATDVGGLSDTQSFTLSVIVTTHTLHH